MADISIINPGLFTTIQDRGRYGYQQFGMPVTGAMDDFSLRIANILVGNDEYEAAFETTLNGPEILFNIDAVVAITGANMSPKVNGHTVPMWRSIKLTRGDVLSFGAAITGCRGYIAFAGGFDIPAVMGSRSTFIRGGIGGYDGRKLKGNDEINIRKGGSAIAELVDRVIPVDYIPAYEPSCSIRAVLGPQDDCFSGESIDRFFGSEYAVTNEADRMGYRLSGPVLGHKSGADIISDGINLGSIQVPGHGMPIVMMADRQTTGGYTKIATVISADISKMAQLKPGDRIRFKSIDVYEAQKALKEYEGKIHIIKDFVKNNQLHIVRKARYDIRVMGKSFNVLVEELKDAK
ncbi:MAG: biotin-dependent carboxyltransferase family protein [Caulobacteraceae bacterium]